MKKNETIGNVIVYAIVALLLTIIIGVNWGLKALMATAAFLIGAYLYFNLLLTLAYLIKERSWQNTKVNLMLYLLFSIAIFLLSFYCFGIIFAIKSFGFALILFIVQLYFIIKS